MSCKFQKVKLNDFKPIIYIFMRQRMNSRSGCSGTHSSAQVLNIRQSSLQLFFQCCHYRHEPPYLIASVNFYQHVWSCDKHHTQDIKHSHYLQWDISIIPCLMVHQCSHQPPFILSLCPYTFAFFRLYKRNTAINFSFFT